MDLSEDKKREYIKRILLSRMRILVNYGFFGLLLMHMQYAIDENCRTVSTDGKYIYFGPQYLEKLSDEELDFVMMHEIMHVVLKHCFRTGDRDSMQFNIACDIVVNSNILLAEKNKKSVMAQIAGWHMHLAPNGKEGHEYTAEQVYAMLPPVPEGEGIAYGSGKSGESDWGGDSTAPKETVDEHTKWGTQEEEEVLQEQWEQRMSNACAAMSKRNPGSIPKFAQRFLKEIRKGQTDWRTILTEFVQEEVSDYSFSPPDRRFGESPFFLPDFNEKDDIVEDILFMIDTSGSMSEEMITAAYYEVKGAIDQFNGKLRGWLGFFDAAVVPPQPFSDEAEFEIIKPRGGGGTSFTVIFEYIFEHMLEKLPVSIIIMTDGYAPFPEESAAGNIPVLWLIVNEDVTPPWGKVARIETG